MIITSDTYKEYIKKKSRTLVFEIVLTYTDKDGNTTMTELTENDIDISSLKFKSQSINGVFGFGSAAAKTLNFTLKNTNGKFDGCKLKGGRVSVSTGVRCGESTESVKIGEFNIQSAGQPKQLIRCEAADDMILLEKEYVPNITGIPTGKTILEDICSQVGLTFVGSFENYNSIQFELEELSGKIMRDLVRDAAFAAGGFAMVDGDNNLKIINFVDNLTSDPYEINESNMRISSEFYNEGHTITGICYKSTKEFLRGTTDYCISIPENIFIEKMSDTQKNTLLDNLYSQYQDFLYFPFVAKMRFDGSLQVGDYVKFTNVKTINGVEDVYSFIGSLSCNLNGNMNITADETDEIDLQKMLERNTVTSDGTETVEVEENENLLLLSEFNKVTMPGLGRNEGSWTNSEKWLECVVTGTQFIFPCQRLTAGTYTLSLFCKRNEYCTDAQLTSSTLSRWYVGAGVVQSSTKEDNLTTNITTNNSKYFNVTSNEWKWVSFTFYFSGHGLEENNFIKIQAYSQNATRGELYLIRAQLEKGDSFTGYREPKDQFIRRSVVHSTFSQLKTDADNNTYTYSLKGEVLRTMSGMAIVPYSHLSTIEYTPGHSIIFMEQQLDDPTVIKITSTRQGFLSEDKERKTSIMFMRMSPQITAQCTSFSEIYQDVDNNICINTTGLLLNGKQVATLDDIPTTETVEDETTTE